MSNITQAFKINDIESAMISCLNCEYNIELAYKAPYPYKTNLSQYTQMRKDIAHKYFNEDLSDENKEALRKMFVEINKKMARYLNIITE